MKYAVFIVVSASGVVLVPGLGQAHAQLESTVPPVGSTVASAPAELQMVFSEGIEPFFSSVTVSSPAGAGVNAGAIHTDPVDAKRLFVPVFRLTAGTYMVSWHAVSVDTHKTEGTYHFTIAP